MNWGRLLVRKHHLVDFLNVIQENLYGIYYVELIFLILKVTLIKV